MAGTSTHFARQKPPSERSHNTFVFLPDGYPLTAAQKYYRKFRVIA